jgi:hypothetical protein
LAVPEVCRLEAAAFEFSPVPNQQPGKEELPEWQRKLHETATDSAESRLFAVGS